MVMTINPQANEHSSPNQLFRVRDQQHSVNLSVDNLVLFFQKKNKANAGAE